MYSQFGNGAQMIPQWFPALFYLRLTHFNSLNGDYFLLIHNCKLFISF